MNFFQTIDGLLGCQITKPTIVGPDIECIDFWLFASHLEDFVGVVSLEAFLSDLPDDGDVDGVSEDDVAGILLSIVENSSIGFRNDLQQFEYLVDTVLIFDDCVGIDWEDILDIATFGHILHTVLMVLQQ